MHLSLIVITVGHTDEFDLAYLRRRLYDKWKLENWKTSSALWEIVHIVGTSFSSWIKVPLNPLLFASTPTERSPDRSPLI